MIKRQYNLATFCVLILLLTFSHNVFAKDCYTICTHKWAKTATVEDIKALFKSGVSIDGHVMYGNGKHAIKGGPILHFLAMLNTDIRVIKYYLEQAKQQNIKIPLVRYDKDGDVKGSIMHQAAHNKSLEINQLFISMGASVSLQNDYNSKRPLHIAASKNVNPGVIRLYIKHGAEVNKPDGNGWTPLHSAALFSKSPAVVKTLLELGANPNLGSSNGWTPYLIAKKHKRKHVLEILKQ